MKQGALHLAKDYGKTDQDTVRSEGGARAVYDVQSAKWFHDYILLYVLREMGAI